MSNTKKVTITLTPEQQEKARSFSKELFGKENISGLVGFLIEKFEKKQKSQIEKKQKNQSEKTFPESHIPEFMNDEWIECCENLFGGNKQ
jgi:hypothetical protein